MRKMGLAAMALLLLGGNAPAQTGGVRQGAAQKDAAQQYGPLRPGVPQRVDMQWWQDSHYGLFLHMGLYTVAGGEWKGKGGFGEFIQLNNKIPVAEMREEAKRFNPVQFDANEWVAAARRAGMKYIVMGSKHHEGFAMFDSPCNDSLRAGYHRRTGGGLPAAGDAFRRILLARARLGRSRLPVELAPRGRTQQRLGLSERTRQGVLALFRAQGDAAGAGAAAAVSQHQHPVVRYAGLLLAGTVAADDRHDPEIPSRLPDQRPCRQRARRLHHPGADRQRRARSRSVGIVHHHRQFVGVHQARYRLQIAGNRRAAADRYRLEGR